MKIILGFGSSEEQQRENVYNWILNNLSKHYQNRKHKDMDTLDDDVFEAFSKDFKEYREQIEKEYNKADKSKKRPERYFHISYGVRVARDYDTVFIGLKFWHINSRHALSPDGMALMEYPVTYTITTDDLTHLKGEI